MLTESSNTENCKNKSYLFESVIYLFAFVFIFERVFANKRVAWRNTDGRYKKCLGKSRSSHLISSSSIKSSPNINSYVNSTFWVRQRSRFVVVSSISTGQISAVVTDIHFVNLNHQTQNVILSPLLYHKS